MVSKIAKKLLSEIENHLEGAYPEEGAGFLLGKVNENDEREFTQLILLENSWEDSSKADRFLIKPEDVLAAEDKADAEGITLLGVFHSHPDGVNRPSEFDRQWALPWFSYLITTVEKQKSTSHRLWRLTEDRSAFIEESFLQASSDSKLAKIN